jgi:aryl-alcohol dehydrogenase-like predicted oxidoreductase
MMDHRTLGSTGLEVSPLCLGTMMFGAWGNTDHADCIRIIHAALEASINFIDTANMYAGGETEEIVGKALAGRRGDAVLATKVFFPMGPEPDDRGLSRGAILKQVEASLRRLQTDVIDLYQIHRHDLTVPWEETLSTLTDLVRQGKVRHIGCSTNHYDVGDQPRLTAWQIVETLWISEKSGYERFVSLQPPYSILRRTMEREHFPMSLRFQMGNIVWSPLEGGWLADKYRFQGQLDDVSPRFERWMKKLDDPKFERRSAAVESLSGYLKSKNRMMAEFSLAWVLDNPAVTSAIIGPRTLEQLESCLEALAVPIDDEDRAAVDGIVPPGETVL